MSPWKKFRYRLEIWAVSGLYRLIPRLSRRAAHRLGQGLGSLAYRFDKRGRTTALENLSLVFGGEKEEAEIESLARRSYQGFAQTVVDQFWSPRLTEENYLDHCQVELEDAEAVERARETGAIWVTPHYSNFEWIALFMGFRGYGFTIVAQDFKNKGLTDIYKKNREVSGHQVIPQRGAVMRLLKNLKRRGHAAFLTDLTIRPSKAATLIECFGKKTCVTALHAELMKRTDLPVIPGICLPREDGTYLFRGFAPLEFGPEDNEQTIAQKCWDVFEPVIRENPAPWLWMYKHWRYLPGGAAAGDGDYPAYARPSEAFEEMERRLRERG